MPPSTRGKWRLPTRCATSARLPPHSVPATSRSGPSSGSSHFVAIAGQHAPEVLVGECRWRLGPEVVRGHRPGEGHHAGVGQRGELECREVRMPEPALAGAGERRKVDAVEQPRPAVAAARRDREVDAGIRGHPRDGGQPLVVRRGKALPARRAGRVDDDLVARRRQPRRRARERRRVGDEAGGSVDADAQGAHGQGRSVDAGGFVAGASAPGREEVRQQPAAFVGADAGDDRRVVIEPRPRRRDRRPSRRPPSSDRARRRPAARCARA